MRKVIKMVLILSIAKHAVMGGVPKSKDYHIEPSQFRKRARTTISLVIK